MLSRAYKQLGMRRAAKQALLTGVERHPKEALCHGILGTWLAQESAGRPELRQQAVKHWKLAARFNAATWGHLDEEISLLQALAPDDHYPPVPTRVLRYVESLKAIGLFENLTVEQVVKLAIDSLGAESLRERRSRLEGIVSLDRRRYVASDWRYDACDVLEHVALLLEPRGVALVFEDESEIDGRGAREVRFSLAGRSRKIRARGVDELARAINDGLARIKAAHRLYELTRSRRDDHYEFLLLRAGEAAAARRGRLMGLALP
jgi:hypothetical protein